VLPTAVTKGCYFHFNQLIWRRIQTEHKASLYKKNKDFNILIRKFIFLSFVPPTEIQYYYNLLNNEIKKLYFYFSESWLSYFEKLYIGYENNEFRFVPRPTIYFLEHFESV
jgi:hypothetical protein